MVIRDFFIGTAILISLFIISTSAFAGFSLPGDAYRMYELKGALNEAKTDGWALTFLFSDENASCPITINQTNHVIKELSDDSIIVYCNPSKEEVNQCPEIVLQGLHSKCAGRFIPIVVIVSSDVQRIIDIVPSGRVGDDRYLELLRAAKQRIKEKPSLWDKAKSKFRNFLK